MERQRIVDGVLPVRTTAGKTLLIKTMDSKKLKTLVMGEFIYNKGYIALFTESWGACDVLGIRRSRYVVEFEIKVSKSDLAKEIACIKGAVNKTGCHGRRCKFLKHKEYLLNETWNPYLSIYRPNYFYFVVPMELERNAIEGVAGTPYGVMAYGEWTYELEFYKGTPRYEVQTRNAHGFKESVKAKPIHKEKVSDERMIDLIRKASTELYETRKKLYLS